jgi:hypothetical protein
MTTLDTTFAAAVLLDRLGVGGATDADGDLVDDELLAMAGGIRPGSPRATFLIAHQTPLSPETAFDPWG